jgi:hypothetical protein
MCVLSAADRRASPPLMTAFNFHRTTRTASRSCPPHAMTTRWASGTSMTRMSTTARRSGSRVRDPRTQRPVCATGSLADIPRASQTAVSSPLRRSRSLRSSSTARRPSRSSSTTASTGTRLTRRTTCRRGSSTTRAKTTSQTSQSRRRRSRRSGPSSGRSTPGRSARSPRLRRASSGVRSLVLTRLSRRRTACSSASPGVLGSAVDFPG